MTDGKGSLQATIYRGKAERKRSNTRKQYEKKKGKGVSFVLISWLFYCCWSTIITSKQWGKKLRMIILAESCTSH